MGNLRHIGKEAEDRAAEYLISLGYTIVTRRYQIRRGEIDLIALDGDVLVFVEVKARYAKPFLPELAIDERKKSSLSEAAQEYLHQMGEQERTTRFDLIAIDHDGLRHHIDAFRPSEPRERF